VSTSPVVVDLEAALAAAKADPASTPEQVTAIESALAAVQPTPVAAEPIDTSGLPGGVDSAPVNEPDPLPVAGDPAMQPGGEQANAPIVAAPAAPAETPPLLQKIEQDAETDAVDIIGELKAGSSISDVANKLLDQDGLASIVKAIGDLSRKVF
jgi:hypothetical protein